VVKMRKFWSNRPLDTEQC